MSICDKRTLQPGGEEEPCKDSLVPPGGDPPGGTPDNENPFFPPPPPEAGNCNIDDDCPQGYVCVDGVCVPDPRLPGGPNTPIIPPADSIDPNVGGGSGGGGGTPGTPGTPGEGGGGGGFPGTPGTPGDPGVPGGGNPSVPGGENGPPFPNGPSGGAGGGSTGGSGGPGGSGGSGNGGCAGEFICLVEPPTPDPALGNPKDQVEGGDTLRDEGEGPVYKVALELCEDEELLEELPLDPVTCTIDTDCPEGFVCRDGLCVSVECEPACCDILEEGVGADEFCELREKEFDPEKGWEVTDREKEPYEQGYPYPFSGTLGKGKEYFDHSLNCQAQNGQELWNVNDGLQHNTCFLPDKYAKVKWEPRGYVFCRRVDFAEDAQTWGDVFIGDLREYQEGGADVQGECQGGTRIPRDQQTSGRLFVQHSTTLYDSLSVKEWVYMNCTLDVNDDLTCAANLRIQGDSTLEGNLQVQGDLEVFPSEITVGGKTYKTRTVSVVTGVNFDAQTVTRTTLTVLDAA